jgi:hypothetical protein
MKKLFDKIFGHLNKKKSSDESFFQSKPASQPTLLKFLNTDYEITEPWLDLFTHFILLDKYNEMPSKLWYQETEALILKIGEEEFISIGSKWINDCIEKSKEKQRRYTNLGAVAANEQIQKDLGFNDQTIPEWVKVVYGDDIIKEGFFRLKTYAYLDNYQNYFYQSLGGRILRGFIQSTIINKDPRFIELVDKLALSNPNTSQDPIHVYSMLPQKISIPRLTNLKAKAKNKNILKRIDKTITLIGKNSGKTKAEIEESVITDLGINLKSQLVVNIGNVDCIFEIHNIKEQKTYYKISEDKIQKSIPKKIKDNFKQELKDFNNKVKEVKITLNAHKNRIEEFYLINRNISYSIFKENYIENNLIQILSKNLIWNFKNEEINVNLIFSERGFIDENGKNYSKELSNTNVSLWHPIGFDSTYILNWRKFILNNEILQPFKQAFREIYIITDAELNTESYSNRFASHILNKDHISALCKVRGWSPSGIINSGKATYKIPESDYKVEYWVNDIYLGEHSKTYGSAHVSTDQVRFYKKKEQLILSEVPAIIFSEVMRDIDMFVGVTSIGNDPGWHDRGDGDSMNYWSSYSRGDLTERSKTRAEILKNIIPKMKIADRCAFDGRYLSVSGNIRNYKIHMGSGNILMQPDDQYLCIVADSSASKLKKIFIPFEGDNMLSIIISKALLLAEDHKIKDPTILRQINR